MPALGSISRGVIIPNYDDSRILLALALQVGIFEDRQELVGGFGPGSQALLRPPIPAALTPLFDKVFIGPSISFLSTLILQRNDSGVFAATACEYGRAGAPRDH